ncbi:Fur family transcriptional regulator [Eisenibacter elegans]|uniref:Fur family transcriptional regulator n=1 Tax=Eisenibacter elegans TaxID=997 RepID=UPI000428A51C|nr:transcriptional repressor [Eisenibacter elegans]
MSENYAQIKHHLAEKGLKVTQQRIVIYEALCALGTHPTAEELWAEVRPRNPSISLGTVYKTLDTFAEVGLIQKVPTANHIVRYEANLTQHNHIYCTNTQEIIDFEHEELQALLHCFFEKNRVKNLHIKSITLQISGEKIDPNARVLIQTPNA